MADLSTMKRLGPGIYSDGDGALHVDAVELCTAAGYDPTPENIATLEAAAKTMAAEAGATFETIERRTK